jgi:hypothetical protein
VNLIRSLVFSVAIAGCPFLAPARAQLPVDGWAWNGVNLMLGVMDGNHQVIMYMSGATGQTGIAADTDGGAALYSASAGPPAQIWYDPANRSLSIAGALTTFADDAWAMETARGFVYFVDHHPNRNSIVKRCRKGVWGQTGVLLVDPAAQAGIGAYICTSAATVGSCSSAPSWTPAAHTMCSRSTFRILAIRSAR